MFEIFTSSGKKWRRNILSHYLNLEEVKIISSYVSLDKNNTQNVELFTHKRIPQNVI